MQVLVVDDNECIREVVSQMLEALGCRVSQAVDGHEALRGSVLKDHDLVLTDFNMPGENGKHLANLIKGIAPATKVVIMTGLCQAEVAKEMAVGMADGWIFKPFDLKKLSTMLAQMAETGPGDRPYCDRR